MFSKERNCSRRFFSRPESVISAIPAKCRQEGQASVSDGYTRHGCRSKFRPISGLSSPSALGTNNELEQAVSAFRCSQRWERERHLQISSPESAMTEAIERQILAHVKSLEDDVNG